MMKTIKTNSVNEGPNGNAIGFTPWCEGMGTLKYADAYMWVVFNRIFQGLKNVAFYYDDELAPNDEVVVSTITDFLNKEISTMAWAKWKYGFIIVDWDKTNKCWCVPPYRKVRKDRYGRIEVGKDETDINRMDIVWYSPQYIHTLKSDFDIIANNVSNINTLKNGEDYLVRNLGAFGILSGSSDSLGITPKDRENFLQRIKKKIGITEDRMQFEIFNSPVNFQQVDFHIKDLQLTERVNEEMKVLCGYFGVPYDLIPMSGQSTYANQEQAIKTFYSDCISPLAEVALEVGRYIIRKNKQLLIPSDKLTFRIDNVPELKDDKETNIDYKIKVANLVKAMREAGLDVDNSKYQKIIEQDEE